MQHIAHRALQPVPVHPVIGLRLADQRLDRLASLEQRLLVAGEGFVFAAADDLHARVVGVHARGRYKSVLDASQWSQRQVKRGQRARPHLMHRTAGLC